eukprot:13754429-Alexandrium_andersonii.AAC.1
MSASLVGSEMCIRDSPQAADLGAGGIGQSTAPPACALALAIAKPCSGIVKLCIFLPKGCLSA